MIQVRWLGEDPCHATAEVGGKAANLSRLAFLHQVPPGFALPAFPSAPGDTMPAEIAAAIRDAYRMLAERVGEDAPSVAVRSSTLDEDGSNASFAGQHDTYLNVTGGAAVIEAVARCCASARSPEALAYRAQRGLSQDCVDMAVLVQHLVPADVSAVVFSMNPVTKNEDEIVINASWGLGESIVGGTVTPDTYVVRKSDLAVTSREIAEKQRMTVLVPGGTNEVGVPRSLMKEPVLDDGGAADMARLAIKLEQETGWAVDIECAVAAGELYLLQCRPITALSS